MSACQTRLFLAFMGPQYIKASTAVKPPFLLALLLCGRYQYVFLLVSPCSLLTAPLGVNVGVVEFRGASGGPAFYQLDAKAMCATTRRCPAKPRAEIQ